MKLLLSSLLLASLCALSSWSVSSGTVEVTQSPDVSVTEGETLKISCCWSGDFSRLRVHWLKNLTTLKNDIFITKNDTPGYLQRETSNCSYFTFLSITKQDSGRYFCSLSVEVPTLIQIRGNGTVITVTDRNHTEANTSEEVEHLSSSSSLPVTVSLAILAPVLLISLLCFCCLQWKRGPQWRKEDTCADGNPFYSLKSKAARVIYEVPHSDSEVAEMDKRSTSSSTGSSQWCQVPVYESFDYFERVQDKESG